jgi:membrane fusion protein, multidrug efflux system
MTRSRTRLAIVAGVIAVVLVFIVQSRRSRQGREDVSAAAPAAVRVGPEDVSTVKREKIAEGPALSGTITARNEAAVRAEIQGQVTSVSAEEGQAVRRGAPLARIDPGALGTQSRAARSGVTTARNALATAQRQAARQEELARQGIVSKQDLDLARQNVSNARGQLAEAQAAASDAAEQLGRSVVTAPLGGVVSQRDVSPGDVVQPGAPLFTIVDNGTMQLEASVPAEDLRALHVGMPVTFTVQGLEGRTFGGRISRINPTADPVTRQIRVVAEIPNADGALVGNLYAEGRVLSAAREGLVVPAAAVDRTSSSPFVVRLNGNRVARVTVRIGVVDERNDRVEVRGALRAGDRVLMGASRQLTPGTVVDAGAPSAAGAGQ